MSTQYMLPMLRRTTPALLRKSLLLPSMLIRVRAVPRRSLQTHTLSPPIESKVHTPTLKPRYKKVWGFCIVSRIQRPHTHTQSYPPQNGIDI